MVTCRRLWSRAGSPASAQPSEVPGWQVYVHMRIFMPMSKKVGVVGASGYAGAELIRSLHTHPEFTVAVATAATNAGALLSSLHPGLAPLGPITLQASDPEVLADLDLVFIALPHGESAALSAQLSESQFVVDLGADHRLVDPIDWKHYYADSPAAEPWTYGLPELPGRTAAIETATKVANPGCYATALQVSCAPLLANGLVEPGDIVAVAASGTSGAGRKASVGLSATEVMGSMSAYKVGGTHQHTAEVVQELSAIAGEDVTLSFIPMLAPMPRGILATTTMRLAEGATVQRARDAMCAMYESSPFVHLLPEGSWPTTAATSGTNCAVLQVAVDERAGRVVVVAALDNLGKGAAGQAIQNANLMCGLDQATGLNVLGVAP